MQLKEGLKLLKLDAGDATLESARRAYKTLVRHYHPDLFVNDDRTRQKADDLLKRINAAYEIVCTHLKEKAEKQLRSSASFAPTPSASARSEMGDFFRDLLQKLKHLNFFSFFKTEAHFSAESTKRRDSPNAQPPRFKDILKDVQQQGYSGVRVKTTTGKDRKQQSSGTDKASGTLRTGASWQTYNKVQRRRKTGTGPVDAVKPVRRVNGIGRKR